MLYTNTTTDVLRKKRKSIVLAKKKTNTPRLSQISCREENWLSSPNPYIVIRPSNEIAMALPKRNQSVFAITFFILQSVCILAHTERHYRGVTRGIISIREVVSGNGVGHVKTAFFLFRASSASMRVCDAPINVSSLLKISAVTTTSPTGSAP